MIGNVQMPEISRARALVYVGALLVLLALGGRFLTADEQPAEARTEAGAGSHGAAMVEAEPERPRKLVVHVVGAVRSPGLYRLDDGSRVDDAIRSAGGAKGSAALELVNLAAPVADGQQVLVPVRQRAPGAGGGAVAAPGEAASPAPAGARVHLNSATLEQLDALPGVGPVTAQKIIDYRTKKGAFSSVEELDAVPGIGPARLAQLTELVDL